MHYASVNPTVQFVYYVGLILLISFCPMLLALNTFFTILSISIAIIIFVIGINKNACITSGYLECTIFIEQLSFLITAGFLGSTIQFFITKLQQKEKNNLLKITRKKNQLEQYSRQLKKADEIKNKLLSIISHDIKGPLASIRGILHLYSSSMITSQEFKDHAKKLDLLLGSTGSLLDNLLFWSIYQNANTPLSVKKYNINSLVAENFNLYYFISREKNIKLINNVDKFISGRVDKTLINLVLRNLISNAVKFTENGEISVYTTYKYSMLSIIVEDTGLGMSSEQIDKIYQLNDLRSMAGTREEKGTGIGLLICKEFIEKHGGRLRVESQLRYGTKITIELPQQHEDIENTPTQLVRYESKYVPLA
jgi:signal transduction histidine kinase